ncbi:uncharacterized protein [Littorina saxatilis]|uniref:uncharacterized protein n=1 Tax=Littorina saxatilis TaxID=31220 RepID=UPI0038B46292
MADGVMPVKALSMQTVTKYVTQFGSRVAQLDRRIKFLALLTVTLFLLTRSALVVANFPRLQLWMGKDACSVWRAEDLSLWQPKNQEWWEKLCMLEGELEKIDYKCVDSRWMGNRIVCFDPELFPKNNCTVYSFGINFDFSFDDAMAAYGCTVYSFDPSMNISEQKHAERVYFKTTGLSGKDDDHFQPRIDGYVRSPTTWRMRRLESIMKELGHAPGALTLLKMDIEGYEWDVVQDILSTEGLFQSIPQVLLEWHLFADRPPRSRYDELISIYFRYRDTGLQKFYWQSEGRDHFIGRLYSQVETSWVNSRFLRSSRNTSVK